MISGYQTSQVTWPDKCWALYVNQYGFSIYGRDPRGDPRRTSSLPGWFGKPLGSMSRGSRRHVAFVLDHRADTISFFLDGHLVETHQLPEGFVGEMDCGMSESPDAYVGFAHRLPGAWAPVGPVQQWRYYRAALPPAEILQVAMESRDSDGVKLRSCVLPEEAWDEDWHDMRGHSCVWYQEQLPTTPDICAADAVRRNCPIACRSLKPCWQGETRSLYHRTPLPTLSGAAGASSSAANPAIDTYPIWNRVMLLTEHRRGAGVVCAREGIDVVRECRVYRSYLEANPASSSIRAEGALGEFYASFYRPYKDIAVDKCEELERIVNPFCQFATPGNWTRQINAAIARSGGFSLAVFTVLGALVANYHIQFQ